MLSLGSRLNDLVRLASHTQRVPWAGVGVAGEWVAAGRTGCQGGAVVGGGGACLSVALSGAWVGVWPRSPCGVGAFDQPGALIKRAPHKSIPLKKKTHPLKFTAANIENPPPKKIDHGRGARRPLIDTSPCLAVGTTGASDAAAGGADPLPGASVARAVSEAAHPDQGCRDGDGERWVVVEIESHTPIDLAPAERAGVAGCEGGEGGGAGLLVFPAVGGAGH